MGPWQLEVRRVALGAKGNTVTCHTNINCPAGFRAAHKSLPSTHTHQTFAPPSNPPNFNSGVAAYSSTAIEVKMANALALVPGNQPLNGHQMSHPLSLVWANVVRQLESGQDHVVLPFSVMNSIGASGVTNIADLLG